MSEPDVLEGSLRIAKVEYPDLDVAGCLGELAELARQAKAVVRGEGRRAVEQFNACFFDALGFHGNADDYYDPRNSYLNDVLRRRTGIPISLAALYCELARRVGLRAHGVGFPGHFLARCEAPGGGILVDCFNARTLTRDDCQDLLDSFTPGAPRVSDEMLAVASPSDILLRMLHNLRRIHAGRGEFARAARWVDLELELRPDDPDRYRERGMLFVKMEEFGRALTDFERSRNLAPDAPETAQLAEQILLLRKLLSNLN